MATLALPYPQYAGDVALAITALAIFIAAGLIFGTIYNWGERWWLRRREARRTARRLHSWVERRLIHAADRARAEQINIRRATLPPHVANGYDGPLVVDYDNDIYQHIADHLREREHRELCLAEANKVAETYGERLRTRPGCEQLRAALPDGSDRLRFERLSEACPCPRPGCERRSGLCETCPER